MDSERSKARRAIAALDLARDHILKGERYSAENYLRESVALIEEIEERVGPLLTRARKGLLLGAFLSEHQREQMISDIERELAND